MTILLLASAFIAAGIAWTDTVFSKELLRKAQGSDMEAQYQVGLCYQSGSGVKKNSKEAALWFLRAAQQGHVEANFFLTTLSKKSDGHGFTH